MQTLWCSSGTRTACGAMAIDTSSAADLTTNVAGPHTDPTDRLSGSRLLVDGDDVAPTGGYDDGGARRHEARNRFVEQHGTVASKAEVDDRTAAWAAGRLGRHALVVQAANDEVEARERLRERARVRAVVHADADDRSSLCDAVPRARSES